MNAPPMLFDRARRRLKLERAARAETAADFLRARAAQDAVERLEAIMRNFRVCVDLGGGSGAFSRALADSSARERVGPVIETAPSPQLVRPDSGLGLVVDEEALPFGEASLDLVVSILALQWANDLPGVMAQLRRALRPDGLLIVSILGGETLTELRQCLLAAEAETTGGAALRVAPMVDAYDAAGLLQRAGFALPVVDVDKVKVRYDHPLGLIADLRGMGETAALAGPSRPLSRKILARTFEAYLDRFADADGRICATFDIVTLTGWAPHESQQKPLRPGEGEHRLEDALRAIRDLGVA